MLQSDFNGFLNILDELPPALKEYFFPYQSPLGPGDIRAIFQQTYHLAEIYNNCQNQLTHENVYHLACSWNQSLAYCIRSPEFRSLYPHYTEILTRSFWVPMSLLLPKQIPWVSTLHYILGQRPPNSPILQMNFFLGGSLKYLLFLITLHSDPTYQNRLLAIIQEKDVDIQVLPISPDTAIHPDCFDIWQTIARKVGNRLGVPVKDTHLQKIPKNNNGCYSTARFESSVLAWSDYVLTDDGNLYNSLPIGILLNPKKHGLLIWRSHNDCIKFLENEIYFFQCGEHLHKRVQNYYAKTRDNLTPLGFTVHLPPPPLPPETEHATVSHDLSPTEITPNAPLTDNVRLKLPWDSEPETVVGQFDVREKPVAVLVPHAAPKPGTFEDKKPVILFRHHYRQNAIQTLHALNETIRWLQQKLKKQYEQCEELIIKIPGYKSSLATVHRYHKAIVEDQNYIHEQQKEHFKPIKEYLHHLKKLIKTSSSDTNKHLKHLMPQIEEALKKIDGFIKEIKPIIPLKNHEPDDSFTPLEQIETSIFDEPTAEVNTDENHEIKLKINHAAKKIQQLRIDIKKYQTIHQSFSSKIDNMEKEGKQLMQFVDRLKEKAIMIEAWTYEAKEIKQTLHAEADKSFKAAFAAEQSRPKVREAVPAAPSDGGGGCVRSDDAVDNSADPGTSLNPFHKLYLEKYVDIFRPILQKGRTINILILRPYALDFIADVKPLLKKRIEVPEEFECLNLYYDCSSKFGKSPCFYDPLPKEHPHYEDYNMFKELIVCATHPLINFYNSLRYASLLSSLSINFSIQQLLCSLLATLLCYSMKVQEIKMSKYADEVFVFFLTCGFISPNDNNNTYPLSFVNEIANLLCLTHDFSSPLSDEFEKLLDTLNLSSIEQRDVRIHTYSIVLIVKELKENNQVPDRNTLSQIPYKDYYDRAVKDLITIDETIKTKLNHMFDIISRKSSQEIQELERCFQTVSSIYESRKTRRAWMTQTEFEPFAYLLSTSPLRLLKLLKETKVPASVSDARLEAFKSFINAVIFYGVHMPYEQPIVFKPRAPDPVRSQAPAAFFSTSQSEPRETSANGDNTVTPKVT